MVDKDEVQVLDETTLIVTCAAGREGDAGGELRRILGDVDARPLFMKGNVLARGSGMGAEEALHAVREAPTQTIARVIPVAARAAIGPEPDHLRTVGRAAKAACSFAEGDTFKVECRRRGTHDFASRDVQREVGLYLEAHTPGRFRFDGPDYLVFVEVYQDVAFVGCQRPADVVVKAITKMRKYAPGRRPLNRAEAKLREALEAFRVSVGPGTRALDLGAAPGGWTKVLAEEGAEVLAVDPADLDADVLALPNVTHFRGHSQDVPTLPNVGRFRLITNDMNREPAESAEVVRSLVGLLEPDGTVIMTVKFVTRRRRRHVEAVLEVLRPHFRDSAERHLPHNARETTLCLREPVLPPDGQPGPNKLGPPGVQTTVPVPPDGPFAL